MLDLVQLKRGHDLPEPIRRPGRVPVMGSAGFTGWHDEARAKAPGLVVGRSGASFGKVHYCPVDYWPLNTALFATDFLGNDPHFVYYALNTLHLSTYNSGSAQPSLNRNFIASIPMSIPPVDEQRHISSVLGVLDEKIDSNHRLAGLLEEAASTLFYARFGEFVDIGEKGESEIGRLPRGWHCGILGNLTVISKGTIDPSLGGDVSFRHFSIPAFDEGRHPHSACGSAMLSSKTLLPDGDCVLLSKLNPATRRVWWPRPTSDGPAVCSPEFLVLMPRPQIPNSYLYALLTADERFYRELLAHVSGTTGSRQRVKPADVLACRVIVPDVEALSEWDRLARPMYDQVFSLLAKQRTLAALRDTLLPKLISGEIRVPDTTDPEEVIGPAAEAMAGAGT